jgi:hypothetical protein
MSLLKAPRSSKDTLDLILQFKNISGTDIFSTFSRDNRSLDWNHFRIDCGYSFEFRNGNNRLLATRNFNNFGGYENQIVVDIPIYRLKSGESRQFEYKYPLNLLKVISNSKTLREFQYSIAFCYLTNDYKNKFTKNESGQFIISSDLYIMNQNCETLEGTLNLFVPLKTID